MDGADNQLLSMTVQANGTRRYIDRQTLKTKEKPNYTLRIHQSDGTVVYEDVQCADNEYFCEVKGRKWIEYYKQHGEWPDAGVSRLMTPNLST